MMILFRSTFLCVIYSMLFSGMAMAGNEIVLPYTTSQHWIATGGIKLQAQFYTPTSKPGPWPTIITVPGSGFEDTTNDPYTHLLVTTWTAAGIAVMAYSMRGSGKSGGTYSDVKFDERAADVSAVLDYTLTVPGVDQQIGRAHV